MQKFADVVEIVLGATVYLCFFFLGLRVGLDFLLLPCRLPSSIPFFSLVIFSIPENNGEWVYDAASEQASQWACDVCTFSENAAYTAECQVCGTPQAPPPPPPPQLRQDEQHGAAEYAPFHDPHAAAVEQQQKQQQPDDGGDAAAWACGVCTFENDGAYRDCEMCGAAREL